MDTIKITVEGEAKVGKSAIMLLIAKALGEAKITTAIEDIDRAAVVLSKAAELDVILEGLRENTAVVLMEKQAPRGALTK